MTRPSEADERKPNDTDERKHVEDGQSDRASVGELIRLFSTQKEESRLSRDAGMTDGKERESLVKSRSDQEPGKGHRIGENSEKSKTGFEETYSPTSPLRYTTEWEPEEAQGQDKATQLDKAYHQE